MRLRQRISFALLLMLVVPLIGVAIFQVARTINVMVANLAATSDLMIGQMFEQIKNDVARSPHQPIAAIGSDQFLKSMIRSSQKFAPELVYSRVETLDGRVVAGTLSDDAMSPPSLAKLTREAASRWPWLPIAAVWGPRTYELNRLVEVDNEPVVVLRVGLSTAPIQAEARRSLTITFGAGATGIALALLGTVLVTRLMRQPLSALTSSLKEITAVAEQPLTVNDRDDFESVVDKFNALAARIKMNRVRWETERTQFFNVFRSLNDAVLLLDAEGSVLFANREALQRLKLPVDGVAGKSLKLLLGNEHPLIRAIERTILTGIEAREAPLEVPSGSSAQALLVSVLALGNEFGASGILVFARDLKSINELESVVDHSDRLVRLGGVISGVGQQFRDPLVEMNQQLELLASELGPGGSSSKRLQFLRSEVQRLDRTIDALLRFIQSEPLKLDSVPLNSLLTDAASWISTPGIRLECDLDPNASAITADPTLLAEALRNIVANAVDAMPNGGLVAISSRRLPAGWIEILVSDEGIGIEPQNVDRIFNLYFSTKKSGSGLGLALALHTINLHRGTIGVESQPDAGTTVRIRLPIAPGHNSTTQLKSA